MAARTRLYFVTDLHGSNKCFRKFLNAATAYKADVLVLGADLAGKAIQSIIRTGGGRYRCTFIGANHDVEAGPELEALQKLIGDHGYYPHVAEPGEMEARQSNGGLDALFLELMRARLGEWLALADERLRPTGTAVYFMLGNDDPPELAELLDQAPWGVHAEGKVLPLDDSHELVSWGFSNITPWHSYREQTEEELRATLGRLYEQVAAPERAILNVHVPPYGSGLDEAPVLDEDFRVQSVAGQVKFAPVGSHAVREVLLERQPLLGLHGHIHESSGIRRLGRTIAINPGSDYSTGALNGALITLDGDRVTSHQLVRG